MILFVLFGRCSILGCKDGKKKDIYKVIDVANCVVRWGEKRGEIETRERMKLILVS